MPSSSKDIEDARREFIARVPAAKDRAFVAADPFMLQAAIEAHRQDGALEIVRYRATGLMLRNAAGAFALGSVVAIVEIAVSNAPGFAACCSVAPYLRERHIVEVITGVLAAAVCAAAQPYRGADH